ncbi:MAG: SO_0444 family Cu/Zn efflux transporter [Candidatus Kapaibacterium sp.]
MFIIDILRESGRMFLEMAPYMMLGLFFVGVLHLTFNKDFIIKHVGKSSFMSVLKASLFGVPLPLCSCGVVPTSVYMAKNGASRSSVVSFLISTPQTGVDSIIATYGMMGGVFAVFRPFAALFMGIVGGGITGWFNRKSSEKEFISKFDQKGKETCDEGSCEDGSGSSGACEITKPVDKPSFKEKLKTMANYSFVEFLDDISIQFIIGVLISGVIAFFLPEAIIANSALNSGILGMLLMILVGIPMYICSTASIPIAVALMAKGFSPGVAFVFLAVGPATNAASLTIITNVLGRKTAALYVGTIALSAIVMGYFLDFIFNNFGFELTTYMSHEHEDVIITPELKWILALIFGGLLLMSFYRKYFVKFIKIKDSDMENQSVKKYTIEGMSCNHCVANVKKAIESVRGVDNVTISLTDNAAFVEGKFADDHIKKAVEEQGYKVIA